MNYRFEQKMDDKIKIAGVATKAYGIKWFMLDNLRYAEQNGFEPYIICEKSDIFEREDMEGIHYIGLDMQRGYVSPIEVIRSAYRLYKILKKEKIQVVQYCSTNASINCSIAAWLARVPVRIYCQWGMVYSTYSGLKRFFFRTVEKMVCRLSTDVQPDSHANLNYAFKDGLYTPRKGNVIHKGSANGVDMERFDISKKDEWRKSVRAKYDIPEEAKVFGFIGRLVRDKGINELLDAFLKLSESNCKLLIVGPYYDVEGLNQNLLNKAQSTANIIFTGLVDNPAEYHASIDFLCLPSYHEGFGSVVIEAASLAVPTICSRIKGPTDFIRDGENGILCDVKSTTSLLISIHKALAMNNIEYKKMAETAYEDVKRDFDAKVFRQYFLENRRQLVEKRIGIIA